MAKKPTYEELEKRIKELENEKRENTLSKEEFLKRQKYLESVFHHAPIAIITLDPSHRVLQWNPGAQKIFGYTSEEAQGQDLDDLVSNPNVKPEARDNTRKVLSGKLLNSIESVRYRKDGTCVQVIASGAPILIDNVLKGGVALYTDITDRRQAEEALQKSESQLQTIIEHSNELFYIHDTNNVLTYVSPTCEKILGYTPDQMKREWTELTTDNPINTKGVETTENAIKTGNIQKPYLLELRKKDGSILLVEVEESPVKDATGKVVEISGAARDVTARKLTKDRLIKSEKRFRDLFNGINAIIYTQDLEGCYTSVNPALCKAFGYKEDELIGRPASDFMRPELVPAFKSEYLELLKKHGHHEGTTIYNNKNGDEHYLGYKSALIIPEDGEPFISGTGRDITENILSEKKLARLQEQVNQSQRMESIGTLAGGIAHDFNNILSPIMGHTEILLMDALEDNSSQASLNQIYTAALRAKELVKQILTFSRQENSELKSMKMQPIVKEALKLIRSTIPTTIEIVQDIDPDCGVIKADPTQIHQIIMNLSTNAFHAMEETGGELSAGLKEIQFGKHDVIDPGMEPGTYACLTIIDTGIGMNKKLTKKIFDPFFTTKKQGKGTGMGLSVVHGIVRGMGGTIQVYSEPGKGTKFNVYFPLEKKFSEEQNIQDMQNIIGGTERILLVDDEEGVINIGKQMMEYLGYQVTGHTSSLDALEAFQENPDGFELVITDMEMPNMTGDKLSVELTKIRPDIPVLLCSGFRETMTREKAASLGIKNFLLKPISIKNLSQKIREVMDEN
jgi:PAS domain S-box-containing protein